MYGSILKQVTVLVSVHAGGQAGAGPHDMAGAAQVVGAYWQGSQELAGREQADGDVQVDMMISDEVSVRVCFVVIVIL